MKGGTFKITTTVVGRKSWIQFLSIRKLIYKAQLRGIGARIDDQCEPLLLTLDISILYFSIIFSNYFSNRDADSYFFDCFYTGVPTMESGDSPFWIISRVNTNLFGWLMCRRPFSIVSSQDFSSPQLQYKTSQWCTSPSHNFYAPQYNHIFCNCEQEHSSIWGV